MGKILVVDHSQAIQKAIQTALRPFQINLLFASSLSDTLSYCEKDTFDCIILDSTLPQSTNISDFHKIRHSSKTPLVFLKGSFNQVDTKAIEELKTFLILNKPFSTEDLLGFFKDKLRLTLPLREASRPSMQLPISDTRSQIFSPSSRNPMATEEKSAANKNLHKEIFQAVDSWLDVHDVRTYVKTLVDDYCRQHFKEIAKDVLAEELKRLVEEKNNDIL